MEYLDEAQALTLPRRVTEILAKSPMAGFYAGRVVLEENTSSFDRLFALVFWPLYLFSFVSIMTHIDLNSLGILECRMIGRIKRSLMAERTIFEGPDLLYFVAFSLRWWLQSDRLGGQ